jgi:hypothetical protein
MVAAKCSRFEGIEISGDHRRSTGVLAGKPTVHYQLNSNDIKL